MKDPFTQSNLILPQPPRIRGWAAMQDGWYRFCRAAAALPQTAAVTYACRGIWRYLSADIRFACMRFWGRFAPFAVRQARRFWHWLTGTRAAQACADWWQRFRSAVLALPQYQFLQQVHRFFHSHPLAHFAFYLALILSIEIPLCLSSAAPRQDESIYLLVDETGPEVIFHYPTENRTTQTLQVSSQTTTGDAQLILQPHQDITVIHNNERYQVESRLETVANLLRRMDLTPSENEMVAINITGDTPLIHISDELRYRRREKVETGFGVRSFPNYSLEYGTTNIVQAGKTGSITDTYEDVYRKGQIVASLLVDRSDDSAVTQIIEVGRLVHSVAQDERAVADRPFHNGSEGGYLIFESGVSMIYTKKVVCNSTAYYGGTRTATGHATGVGVIAVDPKVFPYGTSMYIGSVSGSGSYYGIGTAYDCGGAVKGNIIDVWFPTYGDCVPWGRRNVTCYILQDTHVT